MRLAPMTVFMFVIYLSIGVFDQIFDANLNAYGNGSTSFLFNTLLQPWNWSGTIVIGGISFPTFILLFGSIVSVGVGVAVTGSLFGRSDISVLAPMAAAFASLGAIPIISLYNFVTRNVALFSDCTIGVTCAPAQIAGALSAGVLAIMYLFTVFEWWFWRQTTQ
jgi:hypothetical protein